MLWLQWGTIDFLKGLGGVETYARSLARELKQLGVKAEFLPVSIVPEDLTDASVVQTHGSAIPYNLWKILGLPFKKRHYIHIHTLHGSSLGRMAACGEWFWLGGYLAALRELIGVLSADVVATVNPNVWLFKFAQKMGKHSVVCWNGWDAALEDGGSCQLPARLAQAYLSGRWAFVGRSSDKVKGPDILRALAQKECFAAAPGDGFDERDTNILLTGELSHSEVNALLDHCQGLLLSSRYEGNPLVVLEALARGVPVVMTPVGIARNYPPGVQGLIVAREVGARSLDAALLEAKLVDNSSDARKARAQANRAVLWNWHFVASTLQLTVQKIMQESRG